MTLCSEGHDEICYEGRECPACLLKEDRDWFEEEDSKKDEKIKELNDKIMGLEDKIR
jgi:hypothetical protein